MRGASKNKKIWDRVDSEGKYGRWKLQVMGSWRWVRVLLWNKERTATTRIFKLLQAGFSLSVSCLWKNGLPWFLSHLHCWLALFKKYCVVNSCAQWHALKLRQVTAAKISWADNFHESHFCILQKRMLYFIFNSLVEHHSNLYMLSVS